MDLLLYGIILFEGFVIAALKAWGESERKARKGADKTFSSRSLNSLRRAIRMYAPGTRQLRFYGRLKNCRKIGGTNDRKEKNV